jgi:Family of unknown function (DUF6572)
MTIDQVDVIDHYAVDKVSGDVLLVISDHLPWDEDEGEHLLLLQEKLNAYLQFIEGGQIYESIPGAQGHEIAIVILAQFPLTQTAEQFIQQASAAIAGAGFRLEYKHVAA